MRMSRWLLDRAHVPFGVCCARTAVAIWAVGCALCALSCAASQPAPRAPSAAPAAPAAAAAVVAPGDLRMRHPDELRSSAALTHSLGVLEPVHAAKPRSEARPQPRAAQLPKPRPIYIAPDSVPRAYALRDGQLKLPSGLIIHGMPKSVSVRTVREQAGGDVWEITDARGRRLALLKAESLGRTLLPSGARLEELTSARSVGQRSDWGAPRVDVVSERVLNENYLYTIERRAKGTAWIASGLEFSAYDTQSR